MDINHINHHDHHDHHTPTTTNANYKLSTTSNWHEVKFSMAMDDHHHHHHHHQHHDHDHHLVNEQHQHHLHPIIPLFDQQAWPNYLHNHINNHTSSSSSSSSSIFLSSKKPLKITTRENELVEEEREEVEEEEEEEEEEELGSLKEMMYRYAVMQPVDIDPATIRKPKRRNVRISNDPQSVAARHRRERISEKVRILQRLVPGGTKMDTASMLDEAIRYVKFLKKQIRQLQQQPSSNHHHHQPPLPPSVPPSAWTTLPSASLMGPTSAENSNNPREAKVVLMREHFHHPGTSFHHGGN